MYMSDGRRRRGTQGRGGAKPAISVITLSAKAEDLRVTAHDRSRYPVDAC